MNDVTAGPAPRSCLAIVLAAGEGTRMRSRQAKVLHKIAGRSLLGHGLAAVIAAGADQVVVVVGPQQPAVEAEVRRMAPRAEIVVQHERLGTAHAVLAARAALERGADDVLVAFADTPLVRPQTFFALRAALAGDRTAVAALGFAASDPAGYGRFILREGALVAIREERDASAAEKALTLCNAGLMALSGRHALALLERIGRDNAQNEFYLTDVVGVARAAGLDCVAVTAPADEVVGVNDRVQLARAEALMQARLREAAMRAGASFLDPSSVFLSFDTVLGRDVTVEPNVFFGPGVGIADNVTIRAFSHLEGATVAEGTTIGPFARLRPGAMLESDVHIGNFVEIKAARVGAGAKINHLSYIGDAEIGARTNVGAGAITCNYDGFGKFKTQVGEGAFIGVNSALVAPVTVGAGAYVGTGSVITRDVAPDALALARERQVEKPGWATAFRARRGK